MPRLQIAGGTNRQFIIRFRPSSLRFRPGLISARRSINNNNPKPACLAKRINNNPPSGESHLEVTLIINAIFREKLYNTASWI